MKTDGRPKSNNILDIRNKVNPTVVKPTKRTGTSWGAQRYSPDVKKDAFTKVRKGW